MATTDNNVKYDEVFYKEFFSKLNVGFTKSQLKAVNTLVSMGLLQRDRLVEMALSKVSGIAMDSTYGQDFADGSDAKSVVLSMRNNNKIKGTWTASFPVVKVAGKNGDLLVVAYNKVLNKFHYFRVPFDAYQHITHVLEIILERYENTYTEPAWTGKCNVKCKWWQYEVDSFNKLFA